MSTLSLTHQAFVQPESVCPDTKDRIHLLKYSHLKPVWTVLVILSGCQLTFQKGTDLLRVSCQRPVCFAWLLWMPQGTSNGTRHLCLGSWIAPKMLQINCKGVISWAFSLCHSTSQDLKQAGCKFSFKTKTLLPTMTEHGSSEDNSVVTEVA